MKKFSEYLKEDSIQAAAPAATQDTSYGTNPVVFSYGRMQPPTEAGHGKLVNTVKSMANQMGAKHEIVLSHSTGDEKNPLTPAQKLKHAKRIFPDTNITMADKESPTLIHHVARLNHEGHDHLTMIAGDDRVKEYQDLLNRYNGQPDKKGNIPFNFKNGVRVISAGERDGDAESATKIRGLVSSGNKAEFQKRYGSLHPDHSEELYNDIAAGMQKKK